MEDRYEIHRDVIANKSETKKQAKQENQEWVHRLYG